MKNIYKLFTGFFALVLIMDNALAEKCPAGCFCLYGGEYVGGADEFCKNGGPAQNFKVSRTKQTLHLCNNVLFAKNSDDFERLTNQGGQTVYSAEGFLVLYDSEVRIKSSEPDVSYTTYSMGAYGFDTNGDFHYFDAYDCTNLGIYRCPEEYPNSDAGAKALTDCYKYSANGEKAHYKVPNVSGSGNTSVSYDIEGMNTLVKNLQSALGQATKAAQDLESALNKAKQSTTTTTSTNSGSSSSTKTSSNNSSNNTSTSKTVASASQLNASVSGVNYNSNTSDATWSVEFPYGMVHGIASCNETYGTFATVYSGNQNNISQGYSGRECWCRMTSPNRSSWVAYGEYGSASICASDCARTCGQRVRDAKTFREALFTTTQSNSSTSSSSSTTTTTSTNSGSSSSSSTGSTKNLKTDSDDPKLDPASKKKLSDILNSFKIKSATVPVGRAAVYDDGRNRGLTPLTGTTQDTINNRQINSRAATVVPESVAGRNGRDASRNDTRTESRQIDSGRLAR